MHFKKTSNAKVNINGCFDQYLYWYLCMPTKTYYCYCTCTRWGTNIFDALFLSFLGLTNRELWDLCAHLYGIVENWHCDVTILALCGTLQHLFYHYASSFKHDCANDPKKPNIYSYDIFFNFWNILTERIIWFIMQQQEC